MRLELIFPVPKTSRLTKLPQEIVRHSPDLNQDFQTRDLNG